MLCRTSLDSGLPGVSVTFIFSAKGTELPSSSRETFFFFLRDMSIVGTSEDVPGDVERPVLGELVGTHGNGFSRSLLLRPRSQVSTWSSGSRRVLFEQLV